MKKGQTYFGKDDVGCVIWWGWGRGGGRDEGWFLFGRFLQVYCEHCADYWGWLNYIFLSWCHPHSSSLIARHCFFDLCFLLLLVLRAPLSLWIRCNLEYVSVSFMLFWQFKECVFESCNWTPVHRFLKWGADFPATKNLNHVNTNTGADCWFVSNSYSIYTSFSCFKASTGDAHGS